MYVPTRPHTDLDLFSDETLEDPYPAYTALRRKGAAVYLNRQRMWALPRYAQIRAALRDWQTFSSGDGVALNETMNMNLRGTVLASDPPMHQRLRAVLSEQLAPRGLHRMRESIMARASTLVASLVERGSFDAVHDLARVFPLTVVADLVGLPHEVRDKLLGWADGTFTAFGPMNQRTVDSLPVRQEMFAWLLTVRAEDLTADSMGRAIFDAADAGLIARESRAPLLSAYTTAGIDTTISALSNAILLFAWHPDQWDAVRADHRLITGAFNEILRYDSPIQAFTRTLTADYDADDIVILKGERVILLYGSGNRDERRYHDPERFDITRNPSDHLSFGYGIHACAGQGLARMEADAILTALARQVRRLHIGEPTRRLNNIVRGLDSLPVTEIEH